MKLLDAISLPTLCNDFIFASLSLKAIILGSCVPFAHPEALACLLAFYEQKGNESILLDRRCSADTCSHLICFLPCQDISQQTFLYYPPDMRSFVFLFGVLSPFSFFVLSVYGCGVAALGLGRICWWPGIP